MPIFQVEGRKGGEFCQARCVTCLVRGIQQSPTGPGATHTYGVRDMCVLLLLAVCSCLADRGEETTIGLMVSLSGRENGTNTITAAAAGCI